MMIRVRTPIGARFPARFTAVAKAVLPYLPDEELDTILSIEIAARISASLGDRTAAASGL